MPLIVSFTSMPDRIKHIEPMVRSLLNQTYTPDEIILWLPKYAIRTQQSMTETDVPNFIKKAPIKVRFCDDLGPHTKLIPSLDYALDPDTMIITLDDDTIIPKDHLKHLYTAAQQFPNKAIGYRGKNFDRRSFLGFGLPFRYKKGSLVMSEDLTFQQPVDVLTGCFGVLYRKKFFKDDLEDMSLCKRARYNDDIWNSGHLAKNNIERLCIGIDQDFSDISMPNIDRLWDTVNNGKGHNDKTLSYFKAYW
jgi:glycosyltransferase involved in cell wall biosynthesis